MGNIPPRPLPLLTCPFWGALLNLPLAEGGWSRAGERELGHILNLVLARVPILLRAAEETDAPVLKLSQDTWEKL